MDINHVMRKQLVQGIDYRSGKAVNLIIDNGIIENIRPGKTGGSADIPYIAPGLIDFQVNGYMGMDFNNKTLNPELVKKTTEDLWKTGITKYFPTVITNSADQISYSLSVINKACSASSDVERSIGGIHLEGPFISSVEGPRGAHNANFVTAPDWTQFKKWQKISGNRIKIITMSPEWHQALDFIKKCVKNGVNVSIGHTSATPQQIKDAVSVGARMSTHLGNGAHLMLPRHPNYIWEQLAQDDLWTTVISDGFHLPDSVLKVMYRAKSGKMILISDCTKFAGMPAGPYHSEIGGNVILSESGRLYMAEKPELLAGSAVSLMFCVNHMLNAGICSLPQVWDMASVLPAHFIEPDSIYGLQKGSVADIVLFRLIDKKIEILKTIKNGRIVYENPELINSDI
jgi:N-acetylglucosamine-6-phosphate deacetylase